MAVQDPDQARLRRKLQSRGRLLMARLAAERFRRPDLREIEAKAKEDLTTLFYRDACTVPNKELAVLRKHGFVHTVEGFALPYTIGYRETGTRTFELPNGTKVERKGGDTKIVDGPNGDDHDLPSFSTWRDAAEFGATRSGHKWRAEARRITMPKPVELPAGRSSHSNDDFEGVDHDGDTAGKLRFDRVNRDWLTEEAQRAIVTYYLAADARILAERKLIASAIAVIASCSTYGQALDFWPEVEELEVAIFGKPIIPPAFSLVALTDEDKAALCANMASRGVAGAACERMAA